MATPTYTSTGSKAATPAKLDKSVFGLEVSSHELVKQAYVTYQANARENLSAVKTRGLVRGGGRKPWRQKGTGRARFGSSRNPIWRGGGIVFGPTGEENYSKNISVKAKRQAIRQALSLAAAAGKIAVVEDINSSDGKTSGIVKFLKKIEAERNTLLVVQNKTPELLRATSNLSQVKLVSAKYVNVFDVLNSDRIVFSQEALKTTTQWLSKETK